MPVQKGPSSLMAKLGDRGKKAHEAHKGDEVQYGMVNLPAGISGGVAQLVSVKWAEHKDGDNKGKPYVNFQAVAKAPKEHKGQVVEGLRASITIPLYDTPNRKCRGEPGTFDAWYAELLNEFKKLGVDTSEVGFDQLEDVMQSLSAEKPHTKFSTRAWQPPRKPGQKEDPDPMVFTQFDGACEWSGGSSSGVEDHTGHSASANGDGTTADDDLAEVAELAQKGSDDAIEKMQRLAQEAGVTQDDVDGAANWGEVAELIMAARGGSTTSGDDDAKTEEEPPADEAPKKGAVYFFQPIDPKTKKPYIDPKTKKAKKAIECEVLAVNKHKETVELLNLDDKKTKYKDVAWSDLQTEP